MSIKFNLKSILNFIFSFFLVLSCNSVIYYNYDFLKYIFIIVLFLFFAFNFLFKKKINSKSFLMLFIYYTIVILYGLFGTFNFRYIYTYIIVLPVLYLVFSNDNNELKRSILNNMLKVISFLALLSLFFYFLGPVLGIIKPSGSVLNAWTSNENIKNYIDSYYNLHYYTQYIIINGTRFVRNSGLFTETPMFSLVLTSALAIELFITEKKSKFRFMLLLLSIMTTFSTTGIVTSLIMIFFNYLIQKNNNFIKALKVFFLPLVLIAIGYVGIYFLRDKMTSSSYSIRLDDYVACIKAWLDHPLVGNGLFNTYAITKYMSDFRATNQGLSNSLFVLLAQGGLLFTSLYILPIVNAINYSIKFNKQLFLFIIIMLLLFVTTIFQFTPFCLCLIAMALSLKKEELVYEK